METGEGEEAAGEATGICISFSFVFVIVFPSVFVFGRKRRIDKKKREKKD